MSELLAGLAELHFLRPLWLAGLLLLVAWNMSELHSFIGVLRIAPKSDVTVLLTCFGLTVPHSHVSLSNNRLQRTGRVL